jgi:hypothetical protein
MSVRVAIGNIVRKSSQLQTMKGVFSASPAKVAYYVYRKMMKMFEK